MTPHSAWGVAYPPPQDESGPLNSNWRFTEVRNDSKLFGSPPQVRGSRTTTPAPNDVEGNHRVQQHVGCLNPQVAWLDTQPGDLQTDDAACVDHGDSLSLAQTINAIQCSTPPVEHMQEVYEELGEEETFLATELKALRHFLLDTRVQGETKVEIEVKTEQTLQTTLTEAHGQSMQENGDWNDLKLQRIRIARMRAASYQLDATLSVEHDARLQKLSSTKQFLANQHTISKVASDETKTLFGASDNKQPHRHRSKSWPHV